MIIKVGDMFLANEGTMCYISKEEYTDEFNECGDKTRYLSLRFMNGKSEGRTVWCDEIEIIDLLDIKVYKHFPVKQ